MHGAIPKEHNSKSTDILLTATLTFLLGLGVGAGLGMTLWEAWI